MMISNISDFLFISLMLQTANFFHDPIHNDNQIMHYSISIPMLNRHKKIFVNVTNVILYQNILCSFSSKLSDTAQCWIRIISVSNRIIITKINFLKQLCKHEKDPITLGKVSVQWQITFNTFIRDKQQGFFIL